MSPLFIALIVLSSTLIEAADSNSAGVKSTFGKLSQQRRKLTNKSPLPQASSTSPNAIASPASPLSEINPQNFRDSLRMKSKLINGHSLPSYGYSTASLSTSSTVSPLNADLDEALTISSAELGTSKEINVEDQMRTILDADDMVRSSNKLRMPSGQSSESTVGHREFESDRKDRNGADTVDTDGGEQRFKAAVRTKHTFEYRPIKIDQLQHSEPKIIEVEARSLPLEIHFKSASSRIKMVQEHRQSDNLQQEERTEIDEEPQRLYHLVRKPIIQEVREIITPYRRIVQQIQPVLEEVHTVIAHSGSQKLRHDDEQKSVSTDNNIDTSVINTRPVTVETEVENDQDRKFQRLTMKQSADSDQIMKNIETFVRQQQQQSQQSQRPQLLQQSQRLMYSSYGHTTPTYEPKSIYDYTSGFERMGQSSINDDDDDGGSEDIAPAKQILEQNNQLQQQQNLQRRHAALRFNRNHQLMAASNQNYHSIAPAQWRPILTNSNSNQNGNHNYHRNNNWNNYHHQNNNNNYQHHHYNHHQQPNNQQNRY